MGWAFLKTLFFATLYNTPGLIIAISDCLSNDINDIFDLIAVDISQTSINLFFSIINYAQSLPCLRCCRSK